jgi:predicted AAA+ superfamily ATPase
MPAQIVSLQKLQGRLQDKGALETIASYLHLLEDAFLIVAMGKHAVRTHRRRSAPPKIVILNNALISAMHPDGAPDQEREPDRFGAWVENACIAAAINAGQQVSYWREEPLEVDAVIDGSWGRWAMEVKTGAFDPSGLRGLLEFCLRNPAYRALVVTSSENLGRTTDLGITTLSWEDYLSGRLPSAQAM